MRFRTRVDNILLFTRIAQSIERQSKDCIIQLSKENIKIICARENEGGVQVWSKIKIDTLFRSYEIMSTADNKITCELQTEPLLQALKSASSASELTIKLAKRVNVAVLCFQMEVESRQGKKMEITHDVRIKLLRAQEVSDLQEPMCPTPDVTILLPPLAKVRTVLERMARLSNLVHFCASLDGNLKLEIGTDGVEADTIWSGLTIPSINEETQDSESADPFAPNPYYGVILPTRGLLKFFTGTVISAPTIARICPKHCLILDVYIEDPNEAASTLTIYIPARAPDGDD